MRRGGEGIYNAELTAVRIKKRGKKGFALLYKSCFACEKNCFLENKYKIMQKSSVMCLKNMVIYLCSLFAA